MFLYWFYVFPVNVIVLSVITFSDQTIALSKNTSTVEKPFINSKEFPNKEKIEQLLWLTRYKSFLPPQDVRIRQIYSNDHQNPCDANTQELDPKNFFKTKDNFFPQKYHRTTCSGKKLGSRQLPVCMYGSMDCVTLLQDILFMRMPSKDCGTWYHDVIRDVPVGCACMWPL